MLTKLFKLNALPRKCKKLNSPIDLVILCETFLMPDKENHISIPGYCLIIKNRANRNDEGVSILINNKLKYKLQNDINKSTVDFLESDFYRN